MNHLNDIVRLRREEDGCAAVVFEGDGAAADAAAEGIAEFVARHAGVHADVKAGAGEAETRVHVLRFVTC